MLFLIVRHEILQSIRSFRFLIVHVLLFCLVLFSVYLLAGEHRSTMQNYEMESNERLDRIVSAAVGGDLAALLQQQLPYQVGLRKPSNLSILVRGLDPILPSHVPARPFLASYNQYRLSMNPKREMFQGPDFEYVVRVIVSLLALVFVFDVVCGERERGTLKLWFANSVPRDTVLLGKWLGSHLSFLLPFVIAVAGGFAYIFVSGTLEMTTCNVFRSGIIAILSLLYISTFLSLGLMISVAAKHRAGAVVNVLFAWLFLVFVIPSLTPVMVRLVLPVKRPSTLSYSERGKMNMADSGDLYRETERHRSLLEEFYQEKLNTRERVSENFARLSPSASFLFASARLAGTGTFLSQAFKEAKVQFRRNANQYAKRVEDRFTKPGNDGGILWIGPVPKIEILDWFRANKPPTLNMMNESLVDSLNGIAPDVLLILLYNALFIMSAHICFLRSDVV